MKFSVIRPALLGAVALIAATASAQTPSTTLGPYQTAGYGENKLLTFTYTQSFVCVDQPKDDLNYNKMIAARDPGELQTPICQTSFNPTINPPGQVGNPYVTTEPVYVLVPMFSVNNDQNPNDAISCNNVVTGTLCGSALGNTLISLFGAVPEAFKASPMIYTQCPDPGLPPGTCTMHASRLDLSKTLAALGYIPNPPTANVFLPSPNHSHVLLAQDVNIKAIWWQVIPVLVLSQSDFPNQDGTTGITSYKKLQDAEAAGDAIQAPSNFFLFFSSVTNSGGSMAGMNMK